MDSRPADLPMTKDRPGPRTPQKRTKRNLNRRQLKRINVLPDDVLLEIFDFYVHFYSLHGKRDMEKWQRLVHVCQRWRSIVLGSSRRLNLQLYCTPKTPAKDKLEVWPALPLMISGNMARAASASIGTDNVVAALEQSSRVCHVFLSGIAGWQLQNVLAAMQVPFPELRLLRLFSNDKTPPAISDSFLGGSAPTSLGYFELDGIPFSGPPNILLSANHLDTLILTNIPHSGYISPEAIVALLSALSGLTELSLKFRSPQSRPDRQSRSLAPPNRFTLPLRKLLFKGVTEYLEEFVARIDAPQLSHMVITFFNQIDFDCPRLAQFINFTPKLKALGEPRMQFNYQTASVQLGGQTSSQSGVNLLEIGILCREQDWQLSSIEQVCNSSLPPLSMVEDLYIERRCSVLVWKSHSIENTLWLQALLPFTAVKNLYLGNEFVPGIAAALEELVGGRTPSVLPSLENIFVKGPKVSRSLKQDIEQFVAARKLSGHPIAISLWR